MAAAAGDYDRAEQIARTIRDPAIQTRALADVAGAGAAGDSLSGQRGTDA